MNTNHKIIIATLTVTAVILAAMLLGVWNTEQPAYAGYTGVTNSSYLMVPYNWAGNIDLICVINIPGRTLNVYSSNPTTGLKVEDTVDLERVFASN